MPQPIGFAKWSPTQESIILIGQVREILGEYEDYLPLTGRQIFYRLVGHFGYDKTEKAYKRLLDKLNRARRAGMIPFDSIRDDGTTHYWNRTWGGLADFATWLPKYVRKTYRHDRQADQEIRMEVWVEAAGMVPQAFNVAWPFGIEVFSSGGFNSTTMKHEAAQRIVSEILETGRPTKVLHVGDHDPSGVAIFDNLALDIPAMVVGILAREHGEWVHEQAEERGVSTKAVLLEAYARSQWERIAVTEEQIERYGLEEAPPKASDSRSRNWTGGTVQVEAMSPEELADEIRKAIMRWTDGGILAETKAVEAEAQEELLEKLEGALEIFEEGDSD